MRIIFSFSCSGMFRDVPECSGMFRVPGFIDGRSACHKRGTNKKSESPTARTYDLPNTGWTLYPL